MNLSVPLDDGEQRRAAERFVYKLREHRHAPSGSAPGHPFGEPERLPQYRWIEGSAPLDAEVVGAAAFRPVLPALDLPMAGKNGFASAVTCPPPGRLPTPPGTTGSTVVMTASRRPLCRD